MSNALYGIFKEVMGTAGQKSYARDRDFYKDVLTQEIFPCLDILESLNDKSGAKGDTSVFNHTAIIMDDQQLWVSVDYRKKESWTLTIKTHRDGFDDMTISHGKGHGSHHVISRAEIISDLADWASSVASPEEMFAMCGTPASEKDMTLPAAVRILPKLTLRAKPPSP